MKRVIDKLYGNYSPATSTDKDKTKQNDAQIDIISKDSELDEAPERDGLNPEDSESHRYYRKIYNHMKKSK